MKIQTKLKQLVAVFLCAATVISSLPVYAADTSSTTASSTKPQPQKVVSSDALYQYDANGVALDTDGNEYNTNPTIVTPGTQGEDLQNPYYVKKLIDNYMNGDYDFIFSPQSPNVEKFRNHENTIFESPKDVIEYPTYIFKGSTINLNSETGKLGIIYRTEDNPGNLSVSVKSVFPQLDTNKIGTYTVTYTVSDKSHKYPSRDVKTCIQVVEAVTDKIKQYKPPVKTSQNTIQKFFGQVKYAFTGTTKTASITPRLASNELTSAILDQYVHTKHNGKCVSVDTATEYHERASNYRWEITDRSPGADIINQRISQVPSYCCQHRQSTLSTGQSGTVAIYRSYDNEPILKLLKYQALHNGDPWLTAITLDALLII